jgi:hypothetical protein
MQKLTKQAWLKQGSSLGKDLSDRGWLIGDWLKHGHEAFIGRAPNSKKGKKVFFANLRNEQKKLNEEAALATGLTSSTLRQYHAIARHIPKLHRVKGMSFTAHLALAHLPRKKDPNGENAGFDLPLAESILQQALAESWPVIKIRQRVRSLKVEAGTAKPLEPNGPGPDDMFERGDSLLNPVKRCKRVIEEAFGLNVAGQELPLRERKLAVMDFLEAHLKEVQAWPVDPWDESPGEAIDDTPPSTLAEALGHVRSAKAGG